MSVRFRNDEISSLLRQTAAQPDSDSDQSEPCAAPGRCDVSYVLFLEPNENQNPNESLFVRAVDEAIKRFSPAPVLAHVELLVPPIPDSDGGRTHFATYLGGGGAGWQNRENREDGIAYYLFTNGSRWRALPVFGAGAAGALRVAAEEAITAPYSLSMYLTSSWPMRKLAWMWSDTPTHMGHCATLTARVLKAAHAVGAPLKHASAWYSPGSLYSALRDRMAASLLSAEERAQLTTVDPYKCDLAVDALLRAPLSYASVRDIGDAACIDAVRALTLRVCDTVQSERTRDADTLEVIAQKQLATALLRWVLLRDEGTRSDEAAI